MAAQRDAITREDSTPLRAVVPDLLRSSGQPLDAQTREFVELRLGHDFSRVRVHADSQAAEAARSVNALAFTVGRDIAFAENQYSPGSRAGKELLVHELVHVLQQRGSPPLALESVRMDTAGSEYEQEADRVARAVCSPLGQLRQVENGRMQDPRGLHITVESLQAQRRPDSVIQRAPGDGQSQPGSESPRLGDVDPRCEKKMQALIVEDWIDPLARRYKEKSGEDFDAFGEEVLSKFDTLRYEHFEEGDDLFECCVRYVRADAVYGTIELPSLPLLSNPGKRIIKSVRKTVDQVSDRPVFILSRTIPLSDGNAFHVFYVLEQLRPEECTPPPLV